MHYKRVPRESRVKTPVIVTMVFHALTIIASVLFFEAFFNRPHCEGSGCAGVGMGMTVAMAPFVFVFPASFIGTIYICVLRNRLKKQNHLDKKDGRLSLLPIIILSLIILAWGILGLITSGFKAAGI